MTITARIIKAITGYAEAIQQVWARSGLRHDFYKKILDMQVNYTDSRKISVVKNLVEKNVISLFIYIQGIPYHPLRLNGVYPLEKAVHPAAILSVDNHGDRKGAMDMTGYHHA